MTTALGEQASPDVSAVPAPTYVPLSRTSQLAKLAWITTGGDDWFVPAQVNLDTGLVTVQDFIDKGSIDFQCLVSVEFQPPGQGELMFGVVPGAEGVTTWQVREEELAELRAIDAGAVLSTTVIATGGFR